MNATRYNIVEQKLSNANLGFRLTTKDVHTLYECFHSFQESFFSNTLGNF